ncbi:MAG: O-antigen translocase [Bacteroidota bacterium]
MNFIKKIKSSELVKVTSLNGISVAIKVLSGLVVSKVLAVLIGPPGLALLGNFRNFLATVDTVTSLGLQNGIIKLVAESKDDTSEMKKISSTLFLIVVCVSIFFGILLFLGASYWNSLIFGTSHHFEVIFKTLAIVLPLYISSNYLISFVNGFSLYKEVVYINIIGSVLGLLLTLYFAYAYLVVGAILSIVLTPTLLFFCNWYYIRQRVNLAQNFSFNDFDFSIVKSLSHYFLMIMISGILTQIITIAIRNNVIVNLGLVSAGFWEAMSRISANYMLLVNSLLTIYYYPKLIGAKSDEETRNIIFGFYKNITPFLALMLVAIYLFRFYIVNILFTTQFEPVSQLFIWQLVGDFLKAISWIIGLQFFVKKLTIGYIITDVVSILTLYFLSIYFVSVFQLQGVVMAHCITYAIYLLVLVIYFRKLLFEK